MIRYFVEHKTAANLAMMMAVAFGLFSLVQINVQINPTYQVNWIRVQVDWRGASAGEVDRQIGRPLDQRLGQVNAAGVVDTISQEGRVTSRIEFETGTDMQKALSDVETAVSSITSFPSEIDPPRVILLPATEEVGKVLVSGPFGDGTGARLAQAMIDRLRAAGIWQVSAQGITGQSLFVDVDPVMAGQLKLSVQQVAESIHDAFGTIPAGTLRIDAEAWPIRTAPDGKGLEELGAVRLGEALGSLRIQDIATITQGAGAEAVESYFPNGNGFILEVHRLPDDDMLAVSETLFSELALLRAELPKTLSIQLFDVKVDQIKQRLSLILENGLLGLILVAALLSVFLGLGAALWVTIGIIVAFAVTILLMGLTGQTINMVSAFTMIMILGIIVDDSIVVAENIATRQRKRGVREGAVQGAQAMLRPVAAATLTTVAGFAPILFVTDIFGSFVQAIPYFACAALIASLIECFFLLPGHLSASSDDAWSRRSAFRARIETAMLRFRRRIFEPLIVRFYRHRYQAFAAVCLIVSGAVFLCLENIVRFQFWINPENNFLYADFSLNDGSAHADRNEAMAQLLRGLDRTEADLGFDRGALVTTAFGLLGTSILAADAGPDPDNGGLMVELADRDGERISAAEFAAHWRDNVPEIVGLQSLAITIRPTGPSGSDIQINVMADDLDSQKAAIRKVERALQTIDGVYSIRNTLDSEQTELQFTLDDAAHELGLTSEQLGRQLSDAVNGRVAHEIFEGGNAVDVVVRFRPSSSLEETLSSLPVIVGSDNVMSVSDVASFSYAPSATTVRRQGSQITATIRADVDRRVIDAPEVWRMLDDTILPEIAASEAVSFDFSGVRRDRDRALSDVLLAVLVALATIYLILCWVLESYLLPIVIMLTLPLGVAGAVYGHLLLGYEMTMLSLVALVALIGILVNDSIILFVEIVKRRARGRSWRDAVVKGYSARFRAVFLTTVTTVAGLAPLLFETSYQAQFLIPVAVTIAAGLIAGTLFSLLLVPSLVAIAEDILGVVNCNHQPFLDQTK